MKAINYFYLLIPIIIFGSCKQNSTRKSGNNEVEEQQVENPINKYLGYWKRDGKSEDVLRIFVRHERLFFISDGVREIMMEYDNKEDKFIIHRPDADNEIVYSEKENQLYWIIKEFGATTGRVTSKYNFLKK